MPKRILNYLPRYQNVPVINAWREEGAALHGPAPVYLTRTIAIAVMGVTLSICGWFVASHWEQKVAELEFNTRASNVASTLQTGLNEYLAQIVALRALFEASEHAITRSEFRNFSDRILRGHPAILSTSWIPRVKQADRLAHEQAAVLDGIANYRIRTLDGGNLVVSPEEQEYFPVYYTTERRRAEAILGLDLGDGGLREETLERARDTDRLAASNRLALQTGIGDRLGFFVVLPLYELGLPHRSIEERRASLIGFVQGVFQIEVVVRSILNGINSPVDFVIYSSNDRQSARPLFTGTVGSRSYSDPAGAIESRLQWSGDVTVADTQWKLVATPAVGYPANKNLSAWVLLAAGLLVTTLGTAFMWSSSRYSMRLLHANRKVSELAQTDVLTGLLNRRAFFDRLNACSSTAGHGIVSVLYIDLDHFKDVNDTLGHSVGDMLLRQVTERITSAVGQSDVVARFGGDEFAVLHMGQTERTAAAMLAAKIVDAVALRYRVEGNDISITASVGITCAAEEGTGPEALMMQADLALYCAKEQGGNCFRFYDLTLGRQFRERVAIADELRVGIERGELQLHYQPQVEITSGKVVGLEALVRWQHPKRGLVSPAAFIPIAEQTGAIIPLGNWVFAESCRQLACWQSEGIAPKTLAVNLSAVQCRHANLENDLRARMASHGIEPGTLEVELTESVLMDTSDHQRNAIEQLKALGLKIAIDDFGTGYSSLNYLVSYPADRLKIAQELVFKVTTDLRHDLVVKAAVRLAHELGIEVIAEGVESEAQARFLVAAGCNYAQGYLFSRPLTAEDATALLRQGRIKPPPQLLLAAPVSYGLRRTA
jgi:diguanylate cyclase (GGDEF)-like protein